MSHFAPAVVPVMVTSILFTTIAFIIVTLRLYTRVIMIKNPGADDWIMLAAMIASIGFLATIFEQVKFGLGTPFETLQPQNIPRFFQSLWITIPMYNLALTLTKVSIVFQYMRIFTAKKIVRLCQIMVGILVVYGLWTFFGSLFMCVPAESFWNQSLPGKCMNRLAFWFSNAALNITTDIMIFSIPMPLLKSLQLPKKQKIGLMFVFGFGAFVCVTSIIRLKSLYEISISADTSLEGVNAAIWSGIEINVGIACASLPALKPLISKILPRLLSNLSSRTANSLGSVDEISHKMSRVRRTGGRSGHEEIKVEQSIYQQTDAMPSVEGSERSLVNWKVDCYSEQKNETRVSAVEALPMQGKKVDV